MDAFLLYLLLTLCLILVGKIVVKPESVLEYPYFMASIYFIFIVPQSIIIYNQPRIVPPGTLIPLLFSSLLCLVMIVIGYRFAPAINIGKKFNSAIDLQKLRLVGIAFTLIGYFFFLLINLELARLGDAAPEIWTGILTIYYQFFQVINVAFPILLFIALRKPTWLNIALAVFAAAPFIYLIIFSGRREVTAFFVLTIAFSIYFRYRIVPPRIGVIGAIVFATLFIPATGDYRQISKTKGPAEALASLDLKKSFINYYNKGEFLELEVAANVIYSYAFTGNYGYGAAYWDWTVHRYVPAQFLGRDFKESLMIDKKGIQYRSGFVPLPGLTLTGIGDSFWQFGYLGCIYFFFLGGFFRKLWESASTTVSPLTQVFYMVCVVQGMLAITHGTMNFIPGIFFSFLCLTLAVYVAKVRET